MNYALLAVLALAALYLVEQNFMPSFSFTSGNANAGSGSAIPSYGSDLSPAQIRSLAAQAGFTGQDLVIATAIAIAESGGNPYAYNPETKADTPEGQGSYGLWQIYLKEHPEFTGQNLYDPATNAAAAYRVYLAAGYSFQPWSTYKYGTYWAYMGQAQESA